MLSDYEMTGHAGRAADGGQLRRAGRPRASFRAPETAAHGAPAGNNPLAGTGGGRSHGGGDALVSTALSRETTETGGDAREGRAIRMPRESATGMAPGLPPHPADGGETTASCMTPGTAKGHAPSSRPSPKGVRAARAQAPETATYNPPRARDDQGQRTVAGNGQFAGALIDREGGPQKRAGDGLSSAAALPSPLDASPLVQEIVETWRRRQAFVEARRKLILQGKALCRRMTGGDKDAAAALYAAAEAGTDPHARLIVGAMLAAQEPLTAEITAADRHMVKLAKRLPVAEWAAAQKGFGLPGLAKTVGELGDLSAYTKRDAGIWKRAGLAVIDGQRQRRVAGEAALLHGYAPARRSTFWNIAAAVLKGQGTGDDAGPWRRIYDARKALEATRCETAAHAHNRAMRFMTKRLLRDLAREWRRA